MKNNKIGFLGAGRMATAIAGGMVKNSFSTSEITAFDCSAAAAKAFAGNTKPFTRIAGAPFRNPDALQPPGLCD